MLINRTSRELNGSNDLILSERNPLNSSNTILFHPTKITKWRAFSSSEKSNSMNSYDEYQFEIRELLLGDVETPNHQILGNPLALQGTVKYLVGCYSIQNSHRHFLKNRKDRSCVEMGEKFQLLLQIDLENEESRCSRVSWEMEWLISAFIKTT